MRIAVFGAGGVGGYFAGRLAQAGAEITLIARGAHLAALRERGLSLRSPLGDVAVPLRATDDPAEVGPVDAVFFTVKSYDTESAAGRLTPLLRPAGDGVDTTAVISFQNGIDNEDKLAAVIGERHVIGGVAYLFASITEPGVITHAGGEPAVVFGERDGRRSARVEAFQALFSEAGVRATISDSIGTALWSKYAFLCALAGVTSATRLSVGEIRADQAAHRLVRELIGEGWQLARAEGIDLGNDYVERQMSFFDGLHPDGYSSLYHDLVSGRRMELDALHGELVRRADRSGVPVPATRTIYAILSPWAARNR